MPVYPVGQALYSPTSCHAFGICPLGWTCNNMIGCVSQTPGTTPAPTPAPAPSTSSCSASTRSFAALKPGWDSTKEKTCNDWVTRKSTALRCYKVEGVKENCPLICLNCCIDNTEPFTLLNNGKEKDCAWAAVNSNVVRCTHPSELRRDMQGIRWLRGLSGAKFKSIHSILVHQ